MDQTATLLKDRRSSASTRLRPDQQSADAMQCWLLFQNLNMQPARDMDALMPVLDHSYLDEKIDVDTVDHRLELGNHTA